MAIEMYRPVTEDEIFRERLATIEKSKRIYITEMNQARQEGFEEGIKLGIEEGRKLVIEEGIKRTAKEMKLRGMAIEVIAEVTKLSADEILAL